MDYLFLALLLFILLNVVLKFSFQKWWEALVYAVFLGLFLWLTWEPAANQSKTQWLTWLHTSEVLQDVSVLVTLETLIIFGFAFVRLQSFLGIKMKAWIRKPLYYYPPLLAFPALFYLLTQLFFNLTGVDFAKITYWTIVVVVIFVPLLAWGLKKLLPEDDLRLEILFITNLFVCLIGLIATASAETVYTPQRGQKVEWGSVAIAAIIFLLLLMSGYLISRYRKRKKMTL